MRTFVIQYDCYPDEQLVSVSLNPSSVCVEQSLPNAIKVHVTPEDPTELQNHHFFLVFKDCIEIT